MFDQRFCHKQTFLFILFLVNFQPSVRTTNCLICPLQFSSTLRAIRSSPLLVGPGPNVVFNRRLGSNTVKQSSPSEVVERSSL